MERDGLDGFICDDEPHLQLMEGQCRISQPRVIGGNNNGRRSRLPPTISNYLKASECSQLP